MTRRKTMQKRSMPRHVSILKRLATQSSVVKWGFESTFHTWTIASTGLNLLIFNAGYKATVRVIIHTKSGPANAVIKLSRG